MTHDQEEAFALSDRIIAMNEGKIEQIGDPFALYFKPKTPFVAQFIGQTNFIEGVVEKVQDKSIQIHALGTSIQIDPGIECKKGDRVFLSIRPEYIRINPREKMPCELRGKMQQKQYLGSYGRFYVLVQDFPLLVEMHDITEKDIHLLPKEDDRVTVGFNPQDCIVVKS